MDAVTSPPSLDELRAEIARIDHLLVRIVAVRLRTAKRAIRSRTSAGEGLSDPAQERRVVDRARRWALEAGVPPELLDQIVRSIMEAAKAAEARDGPATSPAAVESGRSAPTSLGNRLRTSARASVSGAEG